MQVDPTFLGGAAAGGGAWLVKEFFSFLIKWKKADSAEAKEYRPEPEWMAYCTTKFEGITEKLNQTFTKLELLNSKVNTLEVVLAAQTRGKFLGSKQGG